jgi:hypothetical protein
MKYTIERQFLVPHYQHIIVEAASPEEAVQIAIEDDDWGYRDGIATEVQECFDGARPTEVTAIVEGEFLTNGHPDPYHSGARLLPLPEISNEGDET